MTVLFFQWRLAWWLAGELTRAIKNTRLVTVCKHTVVVCNVWPAVFIAPVISVQSPLWPLSVTELWKAQTEQQISAERRTGEGERPRCRYFLVGSSPSSLSVRPPRLLWLNRRRRHSLWLKWIALAVSITSCRAAHTSPLLYYSPAQAPRRLFICYGLFSFEPE